MPGKGKAMGQTMGKRRNDSVGGSDPRGGDGTVHGASGWAGRSDESPGHSDESPGHRKKAAGAQSARDFAPGHQGAAEPPPGADPYLERDLEELRRG